MAITASGAISITDIVNEFGGTAPHALGEYAVEVGKTAAAGQNLAFSNFYGLSAFTLDPLMVALGSANDDSFYGIATDADGNVYCAGETEATVNNRSDGLLVKYNSSGVVQWQRSLKIGETTAEEIEFNDVDVDSSGNVYAVGYFDNQPTGVQHMMVVKYNASGVLQWQRQLYNAYTSELWGIEVAADGTSYVCGNYSSTGVDSLPFIAKYNSSGTLQWQKTFSVLDGVGNICLDGTDLYLTGWYSIGIVLMKLDTDGVIAWQTRVSHATDYMHGYSVGVDSSGNIYVAGSGYGGVNYDLTMVSKFNSGGVLQWQYQYAPPDTLTWYAEVLHYLAVDPDGNCFISGYSYWPLEQSVMVVAKINSSGVLQWARYTGGGGELGRRCALDSNGTIFHAGKSSNANAGQGLRDAILSSQNDTHYSPLWTSVGGSLTPKTYTAATHNSVVSTAPLNEAAAAMTEVTISLVATDVTSWV